MRALQRILGVLGAIVTTVVLAVIIVTLVGRREATRRVEVAPRITSVPADSQTIARGEHLVKIYGCLECHGERMEGQVMFEERPFTVVSSNLTPGEGGVGSEYEPGDWDRAIRFGVRPDGRKIMSMMPSAYYHAMSDGEITAIVAYLASLVPVDNALPETRMTALGYFINGISGGGLTVSTKRSIPPIPDGDGPPSKNYGNYFTKVTCVACHGDDLMGGENADPSGPPGPTLVVVAAWSFDGFKKAMTEGVTPVGKELDPRWMPWRAFRHMTDDELTALYDYLTFMIAVKRM